VGADLAAPGATVRGNGSIDLTAKGSPSRALAVNLATDLDGLEVRAGDAFIKPAGTPLVAQATATAAEGGAVDVPSFALRLGPLDAKGSFRRAANGSLDARVTLERFALGELARLLPAMADNAFAAARIGFRAAVAGNPAQPASIEARLEDFYFAQGRSTLTGNATVQNPDAPRIRFDFNAPNLDLDELLPQGGGEEAPADDGPVAIPDIVRRIDAEGAVRAARGRMNQIDFTTLVAALTMKNGILTLTSMDFDAYGGHFSAARTKVDLSREQPRFDLQMTLRDVDANQILTHQANLPNTVSGRLNTEMSIAGAGLAWEQISQSLSGDLGLGLQRGKFEKLDLEQATLGGLVSKVPLLKLDKRTSTQLKDLAGRFKVEKGRMTLVQPMKTETAQGPLELSGSIGLDKTLDLRGTLQLQPAVIARLSGNKLKLDRALPVGLKLGGTLLDPKVSGLETEALGAALGRPAP
ncbi:MAG: AsmA family protein, partial [Myxococcales bacterium]|nr:AsmA family protein [Myxococcales bacterium]